MARHRNVETLRSRVSELEAQLQQRTAQEASLPSPPNSEETTSPVTQKPRERRARSTWLGFWKTDSRTKQPQYYGPTSFNFYAHRLGGYLATNCNQPALAEAIQSGVATGAARSPGNAFSPANYSDQTEQLTRRHEESLLDMFWQSYHSVFPILDEADFRSHYNSLWPARLSGPVEPTRQPSALVDIILALCMQLSVAALAPTMDMDDGNASQEGRWLYDRCHVLLRNERGGPSTSTLQCHLYSVLFLLNCSLLTEAHAELSVAAHEAYALGLHHELPEDVPPNRRLVLRRIWWSLFTLDAHFSLDLGRPYLIPWPGGTTEPPENDQHATTMVGASDTSYKNITWLTYNTQCVKLMSATRMILESFTGKCDELLANQPAESIYSNPVVLESAASSLREDLQALKTWINELPSLLKLPRKDNGDPFSASRTHVAFDAFAPIWLQRQRVLLELLYHHICISLYRTFIRYPTAKKNPQFEGPNITNASDGHAVSALNHAMATIHIISQAMMETDLLNCWHRAFQYLWEAAVVVHGFTLSRPLCPFTVSARKSVGSAIQAFSVFAEHGITAASEAARIIQELSKTSGHDLGHFRSKSTSTSPAQASGNASRSASNTPVMQQSSVPRPRPGPSTAGASSASASWASSAPPPPQPPPSAPSAPPTRAERPSSISFNPTSAPTAATNNTMASIDQTASANTMQLFPADQQPHGQLCGSYSVHLSPFGQHGPICGIQPVLLGWHHTYERHHRRCAQFV